MTHEIMARESALADVYPVAVLAVKAGDVEVLMGLLREHPDLANARSLQGRHCCTTCVIGLGIIPREVETGQALIAARADVNACAIDPDKGETSLQWAVSSNDVAMAELLIESGSSVNGLDDDLRPLAQALFYGCLEVAACRGADMYATAPNDKATPLNMAEGRIGTRLSSC